MQTCIPHLYMLPCKCHTTNYSVIANIIVLMSSKYSGFDPSIFTGLAMTARCAGALAHWRESMSKSNSFGTYSCRVLIKARSTPVPMAASTSIYRRSDVLVFCDLVYLSRFAQSRYDGPPPRDGPIIPYRPSPGARSLHKVA